MTDKRIKEDCPFCGCKAFEIQIHAIKNGVNKIYCPKCRASFDVFGSKEEIISKWNLRTI